MLSLAGAACAQDGAPLHADPLEGANIDKGWSLSLSGYLTAAADVSVKGVDAMDDMNFGLDGATLDPDEGYGGSIAVGHRLSPMLRTELEYSNRIVKIERASIPASKSPLLISGSSGGTYAADGDLNVQALTLNLYADVPIYDRWSVWGGVGFGGAYHEGEIESIAGVDTGIAKGDDLTFAWQAGLGLSYALTDQLRAFGGVRYFATPDPDYGVFRGEMQTFNLEAGLRIEF